LVKLTKSLVAAVTCDVLG